MRSQKPKFFLEDFASAVAYWTDGGDVTIAPVFVTVTLPSGKVVLDYTTLGLGIQKLVEGATMDAIYGCDPDAGDTWLTTKHGRGHLPKKPADILNRLADGDSDALDLALQMGAFGCLIFG